MKAIPKTRKGTAGRDFIDRSCWPCQVSANSALTRRLQLATLNLPNLLAVYDK